MADRPNLDLRVLEDDERTACSVSTFEVLTKHDDDEPFMVVTSDLGGAHYHEGFKMDPFIEMYNHLQEVALPPEASAELVHVIREDHQR